MTFRRITALVVLAGFGALAALTAGWIVWPEDDEPGHADAVVVLAGGGPERLREGLRLVRVGLAPVLAVSRNVPCEPQRRVDTLCFTPEPDRTQGEARAVARLAERRGWRSVVVVTSRYHVVRARALFGRCLDADVRAVGATPETPGGLPSLRNLVWEWGGWTHALLVERGC